MEEVFCMQRFSIKPLYTTLAFVVGFASFSALAQTTDAISPELGSGMTAQKLTKSDKWMVATANPLASDAASQMLKAGGNAIDAFVAAQTVLGLTEPQSSGLGGGAFAVYWDAKHNHLTTYDGRETAPLLATPKLFQNNNGEPLKFYDAVVGGRSVGTPGTVLLLWELHQKYGKLPWQETLQPAIQLAESGFKISPRLAQLIAKDKERLGRFETTRNYFFKEDGSPRLAGEILKNPAYAETLKIVAKDGAKAFYHGEIAQNIVNVVNNAPGNPGKLSLKDFADYRIIERNPVCKEYRQFDICGMGPPSSGAIAIGQILGTLESFDMSSYKPNNPVAWQLIGDASRLAFADRGRYVADTDYVPVPVEGLLAKDYLAERAKLITPGKALTNEEVKPGMPAWSFAMRQADDEAIEFPSTSHVSIVDGDGNVLSVTTTIENGFGSRLMANGFLLNNELTDFSFRTHKDGYPIANRVEPGKRPRSSMSPTIVMKDDKPYMAIGSPGGSYIIGYVTKALVAHIDWGLDVQQAIDLPNYVNRFGTYDIEENLPDSEKMAKSLDELGFKTQLRDLTSGIQGILITGKELQGGADPRREGKVIGE